MEKVTPNSKFVVHSTENIWQSKIKGPLKELRKENWPNNPEFLTLKIAYEKKIIQTNATSLKELNEDDKKKLKRILYLCAVEDYCNE